jgi:hypothetical protein
MGELLEVPIYRNADQIIPRINLEAGTNWLTRGVNRFGEDVSITTGSRTFSVIDRNNELQAKLTGDDGQSGGAISTVGHNSVNNASWANGILLHGTNRSAKRDDPAHGGRDYWGSEGCNGPSGSISPIMKGSEVGDTGRYTLIRPRGLIDGIFGR